MGKADTGYNKERKQELEKQHKISCGRCPYNKKENANRKPKSDKYKNKR